MVSLRARGHGSIALTIAAFALLMVGGLGCSAHEVEVVAIANEGFLVRTHRHAVLVDALFRATAPYPEFFQQAPSEELVQQMISGEGEFASIDLVLVSHVHADHFNAPTVRAFLEKHPEAVLVSTEDVVRALAELEAFDEIMERTLVPVRALGTCQRIDRNGVEVIACLVPHSGGGEPANMISIVDLDGFRFLHEGDADMVPTAFEGLDLGEGGLDLCFMHDWYAIGDGHRIVTDLLRPRALVLMHHRWSRASETRKAVDRLSPQDAAVLPPTTVFTHELQTQTFGIR